MAPQGQLVLIHGFPLTARMWGPLVAALPAGWDAVTPDLPGFGHSKQAPARTMDDMATAILSELDARGIERAVIGGLSMGGYVTFALYRLAPERFSGMVLADTRATADTGQQKDARRRMIETVREGGAGAVAEEMLPKLLGPTTQRENGALGSDVRAMIESNTPDAIAAAAEAMMGRPDSTDLLSRIRVPALIVCGTEDVLTPPSDARALHEGIRGSRLELIEGAGHLSNLEAPRAFNAALAAFLASTARPHA